MALNAARSGREFGLVLPGMKIRPASAISIAIRYCGHWRCMAFLKRNETIEALGVGYQIPRNSLALLMIAQAFVVLPHAAHITPWIVAVGLFCGCWRWMVFQGRWDYPQRWVKVLLVVASAIGVGVSGKNVFSLETATGLLIVAFALKLVEMKSRRDAYLVIHLCYFIIAAEFLFDQSIGIALYGVLVDGDRHCGVRRAASAAYARARFDVAAYCGGARHAGRAADARAVSVFSARRAVVVRAASGRITHRNHRTRCAGRHRGADALGRDRVPRGVRRSDAAAARFVLARSRSIRISSQGTWSVGGMSSRTGECTGRARIAHGLHAGSLRASSRCRIRCCWNRRRRRGCSRSTSRCRSRTAHR